MHSNNVVSFPGHSSLVRKVTDRMRGIKPEKKQRIFCGGLYWYPRLKVWRNCSGNVVLDPVSLESTSYNWWYMLKRINGKLVFNSYRYSATTSEHQSCVQRWLSEKKIKIDLVIESPKGLQNLDSAIACHMAYISELTAEIEKPKSQKQKNIQRQAGIERHRATICAIKRLMKGN